MATAKKNAKSSKTAHVLNLLAPGGENEAIRPPAVSQAEPASSPEDAAAAPVPEAVAAPVEASRPLTPPILEVARSNDEQVSLQIKDALESELSAQQPAPVPQAAPAAPAQPQATPVQSEPAPVPQPEPVQEPESPIMWHDAPLPIPPSPGYMNVMQVLVEEKAPRYIKMFGLCTCKHCAADVKALTLNNLVPKYVVLSKRDTIPMLTVYEGRYSSTVTAQLTRACKVVMDNPHHGRLNK